MDQARPDYDALDFFTDQAVVDDPFPYYEHIRAEGPVHRHGLHNVALVTGHAQGVEVYGDQDH